MLFLAQKKIIYIIAPYIIEIVNRNPDFCISVKIYVIPSEMAVTIGTVSSPAQHDFNALKSI
jgi:hypothetical protein